MADINTAPKGASDGRIVELDFIKGVVILLMVMFHLDHFVATHPMTTSFVYTFHMPIFLILSGYLANVDKSLRNFIVGWGRIVVPYLVFETVYVVALYAVGKVLPTNNHVEILTPQSVLFSLLVHPKGTYWYLHTLAIALMCYYGVFRLRQLSSEAKFLITACILFAVAQCGLIRWENVMYFVIGIYVRWLSLGIRKSVAGSLFILIPLIILCIDANNFVRGNASGILITLAVISLLMSIYPYAGQRIQAFFNFMGRNSMVLVVFSPLFTVPMKFLVPLFWFDPTALLFALTALLIIVMASFGCAILCDKLHLSRLLFRREHVIAY